MALKGAAIPRTLISHLGSEDLGCNRTGFSLNWKREVKTVCGRRWKDRFACGMRSEMVDHKEIKLSKRLQKDLNSLPKPLTMADLSSTSNDGSKVCIAFKGIPGAYSEDAALKAYPQCETIPCKEFEDAFEAVELWLADKAVLPIENSFGGSIHRNYDLLLRHRLHIVGEVQLPASFSLLGLPSVGVDQLKCVMSHPQDDPDSITRFIVLARDPIIPRTDKPFKTSVVFSMEEGPGLLFKF